MYIQTNMYMWMQCYTWMNNNIRPYMNVHVYMHKWVLNRFHTNPYSICTCTSKHTCTCECYTKLHIILATELYTVHECINLSFKCFNAKYKIPTLTFVDHTHRPHPPWDAMTANAALVSDNTSTGPWPSFNRSASADKQPDSIMG